MIWVAGESGERELGGLRSHSGSILLGQVFIHDCDLIMASWDILNLKQHEVRNPISLNISSFFLSLLDEFFLQI